MPFLISTSRLCLLSAAALACGALPVCGQSLFGTILGTVTDTSQAGVPNALVQIRNLDTNAVRAVRTNSSGDYQAPALPVGDYEISCEASGFRRALVPRVTLTVDQRARIDVRLDVGALEQQIEIAARAPIVDTDTASQGTVVDNRRIVELPLNGRNFEQLAVLAPGVIAPVAGAGNAAYFSVAGTRGLSNSFIMDGATNTNNNANVTFINPSVDLIEEFTILRNTFNAEFGHGAAQVNVVTKSGGNSLHFVLFEFLRNDDIQARNFFDGARKPPLRRNQFGGTVSGPILIPKVYHGKNKTFWLVNYEGVRQTSPATLLSTLPTQAELGGDLSAINTAVKDPATGLPFPGNQIPASRIDPTTAIFRQYMPKTTLLPGALGTGVNLITPSGALANFDQFTVKIDHQFNSSNHFFGRYSFNDNTSAGAAILPIYQLGGFSRQQSAVLGDNHVFRPNLINEFRANFNRHTLHQGPAEHSSTNYAQQLGLKNLLSDNPSFNALPVVGITGFTGVGGQSLITQRVNEYSWVDNLTWIHGRHTFKFGADIRREMLDIRNIGATEGSFGFTGDFTGSSLGDFLLGIPRTASAAAPPGPDGVNLTTVWQMFAQDDWKVSESLTLSLGVRWEYQSPLVNNRGQRSIFDPAFPGGRLIYSGLPDYFVPGKGLIPANQPLAPPGLVPPQKDDFAPRFGFAWRPFGSTRSSVRGSYGVFYEEENGNNDVLFGSFNYPFVLNYGLTNDLTHPTFVWSNLFPSGAAAGSVSFNSMAPRMPMGYIQQWSLDLQREIAPNLALEVGYMGSKGTKLDFRDNANQAVLDIDPSHPTPLASREPYPAFATNSVLITRNGFSHYEALTARLERRFSGGLEFLAAYTFSKTIDNSSFAGNIGAQPAQPMNSYARGEEKGLSYFDVPHRLVVSYVWELPFGRGKPYLNRGGVLDYALGGWQLSGITQMQSGNPWSVLVAGDPANVGTPGVQRAELVGDLFPSGFQVGGPARLRFNPGAFAIPAKGTFGNTGRNIIRDAGLNNWDMGVGKQFSITERAHLQFRAEMFNAWNHTQFNQFNNVVNNPTFGSWTSAMSPRTFQFGLKLVY